MLIRDTVTAQERLSGLQTKGIRNRLFNKRQMATKNKKYKKSPENTQLLLKNLRVIDGIT